MHAIAFVLSMQLLAAQAPAPIPSWIEVFQRIYSESQSVKLGANDSVVEQAWTGVLQAGPQNPYFQQGAGYVAHYYSSQGYELKATQTWLRAIEMSRSLPTVTSLRQQLASHYQNSQQLRKAAETYRGLLGEIGPEDFVVRASALNQLAWVEDQMGELEAAEAHFREADAMWKKGPAMAPGTTRWFSPAGSARVAAFTRNGMTVGRFGPGGLASFYERHGRFAEAEAFLQQTIAEARQQNSLPSVRSATQQYIQLLRSTRRLDEAIALSSKLIGEEAASSDPSTANFALLDRQMIAHMMTEAGQKDEAITILRQNIDTAPTPDAKGQALQALSQMLVTQQRFEDAEKAIEAARQFAASSGPNHMYLQQSLNHVQAQVRDMQRRPEEAAELRRPLVSPPPSSGPVPIWTLLEPVQRAIGTHNYDAAIAMVENLLPSVTERAASNPAEIAAIVQIATQLPVGAGKNRLLGQALSLLDGITPADHPRLIEAYGQIVFPLGTTDGMQDQALPVLDRMEKIMIATRGEDSPALNQINRHRVQLLQQVQNWEAAIAENKKMADRSEAAAGPRSQIVLNDLRELAMLHQQTGNFVEEERVRLDILKRSEGQADGFRINDLRNLANTVYRLGRKEQALEYMDRAIELAKKSGQSEAQVPGLLQQKQGMQIGNPPPQGRGFNPAFRRL
jgi:tetratricopeptide (TPR) repeat protein